LSEKKINKSLPVIELSKSHHYTHEFFNKTLFEGKLSRPMLMFTRNPRVRGGYFSPDRWRNENDKLAHEIVLNCNIFSEEDVIEALGILTHEMVHQWQHEFGKPSRNGYHNKEWATKAVEIGLKPQSENNTGTGQKVSTTIIEDGAVDRAIVQMPGEYLWSWYTTPDQDEDDNDNDSGEARKPTAKKGTRQKFICPLCGDAAWGKDSLEIMCMKCTDKMIMRIENET